MSEPQRLFAIGIREQSIGAFFAIICIDLPAVEIREVIH